MLDELRQAPLFADLTEEDLEQQYLIKGERRADDPPEREVAPGLLDPLVSEM
jgi:hypothetical protein